MAFRALILVNWQRVKKLPWMSIGRIYAIVTFGISDCIFRIIRRGESPESFEGSFLIWVVLWIHLLPLAIVLSAEFLLSWKPRTRRLYILWQTALLTFAVLSFLRQLQKVFAGNAQRYQVGSVEWTAYYVVLLLFGVAIASSVVIFCSHKVRKVVSTFFAFLGPLAVIATVNFIIGSGLLGSAWSRCPHGSKSQPGSTAPPVFIIICDELSYDVVTKNGQVRAKEFPNMAQLASEGAWFTNATSNSGITLQSIPSILTGKALPTRASPTLFQYLASTHDQEIIDCWQPTENWLLGHIPSSVPVTYRGASYFLSHRWLAALQYMASALLEYFCPSPLSAQIQAFVHLPATMHLTNLYEQDEFISSCSRGGGLGKLVYWHMSLPHTPFVYSEEGQLLSTRSIAFGGFMGSTPDMVWHQYEGQARWADKVLGRCISELKTRGVYEGATIILTADHGLRTSGALEPAGYPEVIGDLMPRIPLIIKGPGVIPSQVDTEYQHIDFLPTVLWILNRDFNSSKMDGRVAFCSQLPPRTKSFSTGHTYYQHAASAPYWTKVRVVAPRQ